MINFTKITALFILTGLLLGCTLASPPAATAVEPTPAGIPVTFRNVHLVIPTGLASGISAHNSTDTAYPWIYTDDSMPDHVILDLTGYALPGRKGRIIVFRADEYAGYNTASQKMVAALQSLSAQDVPPFPEDLLSTFNAQAQAISSANGHGLRSLRQDMQAFVAINNAELFYYYEGLTTDGRYFIEALLPVHADFLMTDSSNQAVLPPDGIPLPGFPLEPSAWKTYLQAVQAQLEASDPAVFTPSLSMLDTLIHSIQVTP